MPRVGLKSAGLGPGTGSRTAGARLVCLVPAPAQFIKSHHFPAGCKCLLDILKRHPFSEAMRLLYREFFPQLKREFNGTMFDAALAARNSMSPEIISISSPIS